MNVLGFFKQLRRKLRRKRGWLALGTILLLCMLGWQAYSEGNGFGLLKGKENVVQTAVAPSAESELTERLQAAKTLLQGVTGSRETILRKSYVCGEELQKLGLWSTDQILEAQTKNPNWTLSVNEKGEVLFTEKIEDLSPDCKQKAVFGIDENGNLSLFNGTPGKDNVIRTFFQLNIRHLESSLPQDAVKQLRDGIRVSDLAEYNSVLSTFSDYAVEESERAMSPQ